MRLAAAAALAQEIGGMSSEQVMFAVAEHAGWQDLDNLTARRAFIGTRYRDKGLSADGFTLSLIH